MTSGFGRWVERLRPAVECTGPRDEVPPAKIRWCQWVGCNFRVEPEGSWSDCVSQSGVQDLETRSHRPRYHDVNECACIYRAEPEDSWSDCIPQSSVQDPGTRSHRQADCGANLLTCFPLVWPFLSSRLHGFPLYFIHDL